MTQGVRITGGKWLNRKLVCVTEQTRPTTGWARECLYAWLGRCDHYKVLDLASGTGILAFEALSRGGVSAVCVDHNKQALKEISNSAIKFGADISTNCLDLSQIKSSQFESEQFDLILYDPPYQAPWQMEVIQMIVSFGWLKQRGFLYYESNQKGPDELGGLKLIKHKKRGKVCLNLYQ